MKIIDRRSQRPRLGLVGIGGYAGYMGGRLAAADKSKAHGLQVSAMYVPDAHRHRNRIAELSAQRVRFRDSYEGMLRDDIEAVWPPVPIHLHHAMTGAALGCGVAVMCEKPVAATQAQSTC